jgi:hypothetical protein
MYGEHGPTAVGNPVQRTRTTKSEATAERAGKCWGDGASH